MMKYCCFFLILVLLSCNEKSQVPEIGIPVNLAKERKTQVKDIEFDIHLSIPDNKEAPVMGRMEIRFELLKKDDLVLDFNVPEDYLKSVRIGGNEINAQLINEHIIISGSDLGLGKNELQLEFRAGDLSLNRSDEFLYTLFVPDRASTCFPIFDQPDIKASYSLSLDIPRDWTAVFNGPLINEETKDDIKIIDFGQSGPIPSYLFAFTAGKYEYEERTLEGRTMRMYHRETDSTKVNRNSDAIFNLHLEALKWLEEYSGIGYPFEKFDFALIPSFQYGGMEHPGAIFYRAGSLLLEESATINQELGRASLIAHETAHMWFGDLVTMEWFNDVWMKEVFANFMAAKIVNPAFPEIDHDLRFLFSHYPRAMAVDRSGGRHPVRQELDNLKYAGSLYGAIIYQKAPIVMKQLELIIGEETMRQSLSEYLLEFSYGNATWDDLVTIIDKKTPVDVSAWSQKWVYGSGLPGIKVNRSEGELIFVHIDNTWLPQQFEVQWMGSEDQITVSVEDSITVTQDKHPDSALLLNSNATGYAYFSLEREDAETYYDMIDELDEDLIRGAIWIQLWENVLEGNIPYTGFFEAVQGSIKYESNPLIINRILSYAETVYWRLLNEEERNAISLDWELLLLEQMENTVVKGGPVMFFRTFRNTVISEQSLQVLKSIHEGEKIIKELTLGEADRMNNALVLSLHNMHGSDSIINTTLEGINNPDRYNQMKYLIPAVSSDSLERSDYFTRMLDPAMREKEPWCLQAMNYLFHPMRDKESIKWLNTALQETEEIQLTGDIFFPKGWLDAVLGGHQSEKAVTILQEFMTQNSSLSQNLRNKVLQSADMLIRAAELKDRRPDQDSASE